MIDVYSPVATGLPEGFEYQPDERFMEMAIVAASHCVEVGEHPVGAVITRHFWDGVRPETLEERVIAIGSNRVGIAEDPTAHAELVAIQRAAFELPGRKSFDQSILYSTHEPCPMCAGAFANTRMPVVVFGTSIEDIPILREEDPTIQWRQNSTRCKTIVESREWSEAKRQVVVSGLGREACFDLLRTTTQLADYIKPSAWDTMMGMLTFTGMSESEAVRIVGENIPKQ